jgi:hypothetical protein
MVTAMTTTKISWRPNEWLKDANHPFSRATFYAEIRAGRIDARKIGKNTVILTPPHTYFASLKRGLGPACGRGRKVGAK